MNHFSEPLRLDDLGDRTFRLAIEFRYYFVDPDGIEKTIVVPEGFITDFASVPRIVWSILPPYGPYGKAAVIHDCLYRTGGFGLYDRAESDRFFLDGMIVMKVKWLTRNTMYSAVRMFAGQNWNKSIVQRTRLGNTRAVSRQEMFNSPQPYLI